VVALLCVVACATVAAIEVWPAARDVRTADNNRDGRPDVWRRFDSRGQLTEVDVDSNFDGTPDIEEYYAGGVLVRRESDRNFNGQTDLVEEFNPDTHERTRSLVDIDYDGTADLLVLFQDGRPVFSERTSSKRCDVREHDATSVQQSDRSRLTPLVDPFASDSAVRSTRGDSNEADSIGLSTSGSLPSPRVTGRYHLTAGTRFAPSDAARHLPNAPLARSPRAPPASSL
jgi:hypothetical protein